MLVSYSTVNRVVEFEENRLIAWKTGPTGFMGRLVAGRVWRYELAPVDGGTLVRESWDITTDHQRFLLKLGGHLLGQDAPGHGADPRAPQPAGGRRRRTGAGSRPHLTSGTRP